MKRLFEPSAQRMLTAAQAFVQAWREMRTVESSLKSAFRLTHYSVQGDRRSGYEMSLIGKANDGDLLPNLIEGVAYDDLVVEYGIEPKISLATNAGTCGVIVYFRLDARAGETTILTCAGARHRYDSPAVQTCVKRHALKAVLEIK